MKKSEQLITEMYADSSKGMKIDPMTIIAIVQIIMTLIQTCKNKKSLLTTCRNRPILAQLRIARAMREKDVSRKNAEQIVSTVFDLGRTCEMKDIDQFVEDYKDVA